MGLVTGGVQGGGGDGGGGDGGGGDGSGGGGEGNGGGGDGDGGGGDGCGGSDVHSILSHLLHLLALESHAQNFVPPFPLSSYAPLHSSCAESSLQSSETERASRSEQTNGGQNGGGGEDGGGDDGNGDDGGCEGGLQSPSHSTVYSTLRLPPPRSTCADATVSKSYCPSALSGRRTRPAHSNRPLAATGAPRLGPHAPCTCTPLAVVLTTC